MKESKVKEANDRLLHNVPHTDVGDYLMWATIIQNFPITKPGKVSTLLKTHNTKVIMGIAVNHLKSVASIVGISKTYIEEVSRYQRENKNSSGVSQYRMLLFKFTGLLLKATYHAVLQTGES